jgi:hypothetical protein
VSIAVRDAPSFPKGFDSGRNQKRRESILCKLEIKTLFYHIIRKSGRDSASTGYPYRME